VPNVSYQNVDELVSHLSMLDLTESTRELGEFYVSARFGLSHQDFEDRQVPKPEIKRGRMGMCYT
jgi:hypothetical protein